MKGIASMQTELYFINNFHCGLIPQRSKNANLCIELFAHEKLYTALLRVRSREDTLVVFSKQR